MILLEIALQGIRGFPPLTRIALRQGMNVARTGDAALRRATLDAIYHAIYPDPSRSGATAKLADPGAKESRIAITFFGRDKSTYRVVREAANGAVSLHKFDPEQNKYSALTRASQETAQYIRVQQQLPDEVGFERLFMYSAESMPSLGTKAKTRSGSSIASGLSEPAAASGPGLPAFAARPPSAVSAHAQARATSRIPGLRGASGSPGSGPAARAPSGFGSALNMNNALVQTELAISGDIGSGDVAGEVAPDPEVELAEKKRLLQRARDDRGHAVRAEKVQVELDAHNARKFELSGKVERVKIVRAEVEKLRQLDAGDQDLRNLPRGFGERLRRFEEAQVKYQSDRQKIIEERMEAEQKLGGLSVLQLRNDPYFLAGVGLALAFIGLAVLLAKPAIALLNVLCLVVAAGAAFRCVGDLEIVARARIRVQAIGDREQRLEKQFELDTAAMKKLMDRFATSAPHELLERIEGSEKLQHQLKVAQDALARELSDPSVANAEHELNHVTQQIEALEAQILGSQSIISQDTLDRRVVLLEREIAALEKAVKAKSEGTSEASTQEFRPPPPRSTSQVPARSDSVRSPSGVHKLTPVVPQRPPPRAPSVPKPPSPEAASLFDFGGGNIGSEDEEEGYGSGYGKPTGGDGDDGGSASAMGDPQEERGAYLAIGGHGGVGPGGSSLPGGYDDEGAGAALHPDRSRDLVQAAVDLLQLPVDDLTERIRPRVGQFLAAFTDNVFDSATFGPRGEMSVVPKGGGEPIGFMELEPEAIDLVDVALRFSLAEAILSKFKVPILIDDPFLGFVPQKRMLLSQMLTYLAKMTQVLLLTEREDVTGNIVSW
jgi:hypothetical protein